MSENAKAVSRTSPRYWRDGAEAEAIPLGWMDDMVRRLMNVINCEMIRLEKAQQQISDKKDEAGDSPPYDILGAERRTRLAKQMHTSLERLRAMEEANAKHRKPKVVKSDEDAIAEIERRLAKLIDSRRAANSPARSDG